MSAERPGVQLEARRDLSALFRDALMVYGRHFGVFVALAAAVVIPVHVIVAGIGLEQLTKAYDATPPAAETLIPVGVSFLVVTPLLTAICIKVLQSIAAGGSPRARNALVEGFEAFTPLFFAVLLAAAGIALGLILIVPGIYLAVRWFFVPQAVVIEGERGTGALAHSMRVTNGFWWRTFGIVLVANLAAAVPGLLLTAPLTAVAEASDRAVWGLVGSVLAEMVTTPFVALVGTLLYFDLVQRGR